MNDDYESRRAREIAVERDAIARYREAIKMAVSVAGPIAHFADDRCGYLHQVLDEELRAVGLLVERQPIRPLYVKKPINRTLRTAVLERDAYRCVRCGTFKALTVDHIVPESKGGAATLENLQAMCRPCNSSKGVR